MSSSRPTSIEELIGPELAARLDRLDLVSRKMFAGKLPGERRSKRRGQSVEFDDYRQYNPGDDLRHVDWSVYARLDRLFIKLFRAEEDLAVHIVLDASASMDAGGEEGTGGAGNGATKLVFAQQVAMALSYVALVNQNRLCLSIVGGGSATDEAGNRAGLVRLAPVRGRRGVERAARFLLDRTHSWTGAPSAGGVAGAARLAGNVGLNAALRQIAMDRKVGGAGVMVLLSDFLIREDISKGLDYLAAGARVGAGFDTYCMQILSPGEIDPTTLRSRGLIGDLRLTDVETGRGAEVTMSPALIKRYKQRLDALCENLSKACAARRMTHLVVQSDTDIAQLVTDQLRQLRLLG